MTKISEKRKEETVFKKASELSILCGIEVCLISYGVNGDIKTFPKDQERVANLALRFTELDKTSRRKRSVSLDDILEDTHVHKMKKKKDHVQKMKKKKKKKDSNLGSEFDYYSSDQLNLAVESIDRKLQSLYEALENKKKNKKKSSHGNDASSQLPLIATSSSSSPSLLPPLLPWFLPPLPLPAYLPMEENNLGFHSNDDDKNFDDCTSCVWSKRRVTPFVEFGTQFNQDESRPQTSDLPLPYLESFEKKDNTRKQDLGFQSNKNNIFNGFLQEPNQFPDLKKGSLLEDLDDEDFILFRGAEETCHQGSFENNNTKIEESGLRNTVFGSNWTTRTWNRL